MKLRFLTLALAVAALAGCGGESGGKSTLWITRDAGAHVLLVLEVPAGLTAMQALDRAADVKTRYAGRFVQAINGIEGSLNEQRDWFYFINGIQADRSAAEYRLHRGDIEWWDYRSWAKQMQQPVVVGAFPEPFRHGTTVVNGSARIAGRLLNLIGSSGKSPRNVIELIPGRGFHAELKEQGVSATLGLQTARRLIRDPSAVRFRYEVP